jgi:hypothetical protein
MTRADWTYGVFALFGVLVFWGSSNASAALRYLVVPAVLFGAAALASVRAWSRPSARRG